MAEELRGMTLTYSEGQYNKGMIFEAIPKAIGMINAIYKGGVNKDQGYNFLSHEDIAKELQPLLSECGITPLPMPLELIRERGQTAKGTIMNKYTLSMKIRFHAKDSSWVEAGGFAEAMDTSDKGISKAMTMATKSIYKIIFCLPTTDKLENEWEEHEEKDDGKTGKNPPKRPSASGKGKSNTDNTQKGKTTQQKENNEESEGNSTDGKGQDINAPQSVEEAIDHIAGIDNVIHLTRFFNKYHADLKKAFPDKYDNFSKVYNAKLKELRPNK